MSLRRKHDTHYSQITYAETTIEGERHRIRHQWRIHNYNVISEKLAKGRSIDGVRFGGPGYGHIWWRLEFFPNGQEGNDEVTIFLGCQHEGYEAPKDGRFLVALLDHDGKQVAHSAEEPYKDKSGVKGWAWPKFCPRSLIANEKSIDVVAEIEYYGGEPTISTNAVPELHMLSSGEWQGTLEPSSDLGTSKDAHKGTIRPSPPAPDARKDTYKETVKPPPPPPVPDDAFEETDKPPPPPPEASKYDFNEDIKPPPPPPDTNENTLEESLKPAPPDSSKDANKGAEQPVYTDSASKDAAELHDAMKGIGCDSPAIVNVLCKRTNTQRQQIAAKYKLLYGKDLREELVAELGGPLEDLMVALLEPPAEYDARSLQRAMKGAGTNEATLIEIMCTRSNAEIVAIRQAYHRLFKKELEGDLKGDTSGNFERLLITLCSAQRDEGQAQDATKAKADAKALNKISKKKWSTEGAQYLIMVLCTQNPAQLLLFFDAYKKASGHELEADIGKELSGDIKDGLLAIVKVTKNKPEYFAERLHSTKGLLGNDNTTLVRVVVTRCDVDMAQIKPEFQRLYKKSLEQFINDDTKGDYKNALIALVK